MSAAKSQRRHWKPLLAVGLLSATLISSGCQRSIAATDTACLVFDAPSWSSRDTEETQRWMETYAVRWERLCEGK